MSCEIIRLNAQNITLVYQNLELDLIDQRPIKNELSQRTIVTQMPELLIFVDQAVNNIIQFGDRRLRITHQKTEDELIDLWNLVDICHEQVKDSPLSAYGFNYDFILHVIDETTIPINAIFSDSKEKLSQILGEEVTTIIPRFSYLHQDARIELFFEHVKQNKIGVHINVHYERSDYPGKETLQHNYSEQYNYLKSIICKLF